jgi:nucleoside-diphosphate-sugar epimerase/predicted dehydrogenase
MQRVALVGAGYISRVHAEALQEVAGVRLAAVIDPDLAAAERLARGFAKGGAPRAFGSVAEALAADAFDRAHVLVPPDLHAKVAGELLAAGKPVLLEKPLATGSAECEGLMGASTAGGAALGVNQNFVYHPAFAALRQAVEARRLGKPRFVGCLYNVPLRQLISRQFSHWMFRRPLNILLEQAVHPLSQIAALAGPLGAVTAQAGPGREISPGVAFYPSAELSLQGERLPAQLRFAVGQEFPFWQVSVICDDGVAVADILGNRFFTYGRSRWLEAVDNAASGSRTGLSLMAESIGNLANYALSTAKLKRRTDPFFLSMKGSIAAFHAALDAGRAPECDAAFGAMLVGTCERTAEQAFRPLAAPVAQPAPAAEQPAPHPATPDVAVLGGTGFIGTALVRRLVTAGLNVSVMARNATNLPAIFANPHVTVHRGSISSQAAVEAAIGGAPIVVNLAHGGGGANFEAINAAMVGGAETVARACLARGLKRLVHVGSIASLYLGPDAGTVTDATPPDPQDAERADYARAKAIADRRLLEMAAQDKLPVVILRPGLVVGDGTSPFHSGLGFFNAEQHCIGWNDGRNPLPWVLVDDVASAIEGAMRAPGIEGRAFNIVGDVRMSAREYLDELGRALERPLRFHPQSPTWLWAEDMGKWVIKRATGRAVPAPSKRDFVSRGLRAGFDCSGAKQALGWQPEADRAAFIRRAIAIHAA